jgi:hypothetical protein
VSAPAPDLPREEGLYRFVHRNNAKDDGTLTSGAFSLRHPDLSVGIESIIQKKSFERFCELKPEQGVARVGVGDVRALELLVIPQPALDWNEFSDAHAVLSGYGSWTNQRKTNTEKRLRDLANASILKPVPR